jgi:serine/threonine protein phosphatase PrpC
MIICANAGDSRSVLAKKGKKEEIITEPLSEDHKPENEEEYKRIIAAGGHVEENRVNGNLALSRALGDFEYKQNKQKNYKEQMVTCFPEIKKKVRS